jgi:hypothetical protein
MTVAALPGNVRLRAFQLGKETTFGSAVAATRRFGWSFAPTVDPHWTFPTSDTGTLDQALPPYRMALDVTGQATGPLAYNDAPYLWAALAKGGVTPTGGGTAKTWTYTPASTSQDIFEIFTGEWGDETTDQFQYADGVLDILQLTYPQDLGPIAVQADWRFASVVYPNAKTALSVDPAPTWAYAADTSYYFNDSAGAIETTQLSNSVHDAVLVINNNLDVKRFQNGSNTRFQVAGYGRGLRTFQVTYNFAKSTAALAEVAKWLNANPVERFASIRTDSVQAAQAGIDYSQDIRFSGYWFTRTEGTYGTANTTAQLVCQGWLDQTLTYPFNVAVVNTLTAL